MILIFGQIFVFPLLYPLFVAISAGGGWCGLLASRYSTVTETGFISMNTGMIVGVALYLLGPSIFFLLIKKTSPLMIRYNDPPPLQKVISGDILTNKIARKNF